MEYIVTGVIVAAFLFTMWNSHKMQQVDKIRENIEHQKWIRYQWDQRKRGYVPPKPSKIPPMPIRIIG